MNYRHMKIFKLENLFTCSIEYRIILEIDLDIDWNMNHETNVILMILGTLNNLNIKLDRLISM